MTTLPAVITRFDPAGRRAPEGGPELTALDGTTHSGEKALVLGEGTASQMDDSGRWLQMDWWHALTETEVRP